MSDEYGHLAAPDTVRFERLLPGPIERVWQHLTDSELRGRWFASGPMELQVGGKVTLHFRHSQLTTEPTPEKYKSVEGQTDFGKVTRCEPPRVLAFLWGGDDSSEVIFELTPRGKDVQLVLTHRRLPNRAEAVDVSGGWHLHLGLLDDVLRGAPLRPFWSLLAKLDAEYAQRYGTE